MIKKLVPLIMCALCLTACASDIPPAKESVPTDMQQVITPPENGWTAEELMNVTYFEGIRLTYPLTMEGMGGSVYFKPETGSDYSPSDDGFLWYTVMTENNSEYQGGIDYKGVTFFRDKDDAEADEPVRAIRCCSEYASLNGVRYGASVDEVTEHFGTPDRTETATDNFDHYIYLDRESGSKLIDVSMNKAKNTVVYVDVIL